MKKNMDSKDGRKHYMAVSKAVIPMLKGEAAVSLLRTLDKAKIKPYSQEKQMRAEENLREIIKKMYGEKL